MNRKHWMAAAIALGVAGVFGAALEADHQTAVKTANTPLVQPLQAKAGERAPAKSEEFAAAGSTLPPAPSSSVPGSIGSPNDATPAFSSITVKPADTTPPSAKPSRTPQPANNGWDEPVPGANYEPVSKQVMDDLLKQYADLPAESGEPAWEQKADSIIADGLGFLGTPYKFGAEMGQTDTFDCSSYIKYLYAKAGVKLPRDSRSQSLKGTEISTSSLRKGDLIFFTTPKRKKEQGLDHIGHIAIYIGNNQILHTFRVGIGVTVTEFAGPWRDRFVTARRVLPT